VITLANCRNKVLKLLQPERKAKSQSSVGVLMPGRWDSGEEYGMKEQGSGCSYILCGRDSDAL
jgi:hypothetical protein